jgi:type IV secretion system protein VirD4
VKKAVTAGGILLLCALLGTAGLLQVSAVALIGRFRIDADPIPTFPFLLAAEGDKVQKALATAACLASIALPVLVTGGMAFGLLMPVKREQHGSARFASRSELRKAGLLQEDRPDDKHPSIIVGKLAERFLYFRGMQFMFLAAPTRSGKGVGIVIPNLLHYRDSVVVLDIKDENFKITAGFRAQCGQEVHRFAPDDEDFRTSGWNPLSYVRDDEVFRVGDLMSITNILYPPSEDVWSSTAESLFLGLALYVMDTAKERHNFNIAFIQQAATSLRFLKDEKAFDTYVEERKEFEPLSNDCTKHLRKFSQTSDKLRGSIVISFDKPLGAFIDPVTARATNVNSFDLREVRIKRMSIYVCIKPGNIDKYGSLLNLFFQQLLTLNMRQLPEDNPRLRFQCLLLLDEFPAMGRVAIIEKASAYMAGYNMRLLLIFQSKSQVKDRKLYDETGAKTLLGNMALQVCYAPRDDDDAKDYSAMIGDMTWKGVSRSRQLGTFFSDKGSGRSESVSDQRRAVLLPQEVKDIGQDAEIVSMENMRPALADKIRWYREPVFAARANLAVPSVPDLRIGQNTMEDGGRPPVAFFKGAALETELSPGATFEVGFSPRRNALEVVMSLILQARSELLVAGYSFTSKDIAFGLTDAKSRGVSVRVVVDHKQNQDEQGGYRAIDYLIAQGIPVIRNENYSAMHHKFMVADGRHLQIGSFNYTASANTRNAECAVVFRNSTELAEVFRTEWHRLATEPKVSVEDIVRLDAGLDALKAMGF